MLVYSATRQKPLEVSNTTQTLNFKTLYGCCVHTICLLSRKELVPIVFKKNIHASSRALCGLVALATKHSFYHGKTRLVVMDTVDRQSSSTSVYRAEQRVRCNVRSFCIDLLEGHRLSQENFNVDAAMGMSCLPIIYVNSPLIIASIHLICWIMPRRVWRVAALFVFSIQILALQDCCVHVSLLARDRRWWSSQSPVKSLVSMAVNK